MLSFSNFGSNRHPVGATRCAGRRRSSRARARTSRSTARCRPTPPCCRVVLRESYPWSRLQGAGERADLPRAQSANIAYKLIWRLGERRGDRARSCSGMAKPVHVLQRGVEVSDIVNMAAICVVDAQELPAARMSAERQESRTEQERPCRGEYPEPRKAMARNVRFRRGRRAAERIDPERPARSVLRASGVALNRCTSSSIMKRSSRHVRGALLALVCARAHVAADKPRIAVLEFKNKADNQWWYHGGAAAAQDVFVTELVKSGKFRVVEREQLEALMQEKNLSLSGDVDPQDGDQARQAPRRQLPAHRRGDRVRRHGHQRARLRRAAACPASRPASADFTAALNARLIDTSTGEILWADEAQRRGLAASSCRSAASAAASTTTPHVRQGDEAVHPEAGRQPQGRRPVSRSFRVRLKNGGAREGRPAFSCVDRPASLRGPCSGSFRIGCRSSPASVHPHLHLHAVLGRRAEAGPPGGVDGRFVEAEAGLGADALGVRAPGRVSSTSTLMSTGRPCSCAAPRRR